MTNSKKHKFDIFSVLLPSFLILSVLLSVIAHSFDIELQKETYSSLKGFFFIPLKKWIFVVIAAAMFSIFFRSPQGKSSKFLILLFDIIVLYVLSTFIANVYAVGAFQLLPIAETIKPLMNDAQSISFTKTRPDGIPPVILLMISSLVLSFIFRYLFLKIFAFLAKNLCLILTTLFQAKFFNNFTYIKELKAEFKNAQKSKRDIDYSLALINFSDKIIFGVLLLILMLAPLAVFASFLDILNSRGFAFFADLSKFIGFYAGILLFYQFVIIILFKKIFCLGIKGETYSSFFKKALPVIATAGTTASSVATLAANIKAAQSLKIPEDMKHKGHNRALMPVGATFNMDGTSISLIIYFLLAANIAGIQVDFLWVILTAVGLSIGTAAVPSASIIMLSSMYSAFAVPAAITSKLLSIIIAVDPIHDRIRTAVNTWGDLNMVYIVQNKRGFVSILLRLFGKK